MSAGVPAFVRARRSIRAFLPDLVEREDLDALVEAACLAPAPHHSRPWRFVVIDAAAGKEALAFGMGDRWRADLAGDGVARERIEELVAASHHKLTSAPALVLGCLTWSGLDRYPDEHRRRAEWGMALLSLGAAVETSVQQLYDVMAKLTGFRETAQYAPSRTGELQRSAIDWSRAELQLGWKPFTSIEEGLARTLEHFKGQRAAGGR